MKGKQMGKTGQRKAPRRYVISEVKRAQTEKKRRTGPVETAERVQ
jgi:hypothetical protein